MTGRSRCAPAEVGLQIEALAHFFHNRERLVKAAAAAEKLHEDGKREVRRTDVVLGHVFN